MKRTYVGLRTKSCEQCGELVTRKASAFKDRTFCSRHCYFAAGVLRQAASESNTRRFAESRKQSKCTGCGVLVERPLSLMQAKQIFCSRQCQGSHSLARPARQTTSHGYIRTFIGTGAPGADSSGHILEHRKVMQDFLGRPLTPDENVHHKNGDRADNRLENLELWSRSQPSGQRVEDKIAWAKEFLALYGAT